MKRLFYILSVCLIFLTPISAEEMEARALVNATEKVSISSEIAARVESINFLLGDAFKKEMFLLALTVKSTKLKEM